jgi:hypothetical protein
MHMAIYLLCFPRHKKENDGGRVCTPTESHLCLAWPGPGFFVPGRTFLVPGIPRNAQTTFFFFFSLTALRLRSAVNKPATVMDERY